MSSVGPGAAAAGGTSDINNMVGGGGGGDDEDGGSCLLCYSPKVNANTFWDVLEPLDPTLEPLVNANLWAVFVLRKLLLFTPEEFERQLVSRGGEGEEPQPAKWFQLCGECVEWVGDFRTVLNQAREEVPGAEEKVNSMRRQVKDKLRSGLSRGDRGSQSQDLDDILDFLKREVEEEDGNGAGEGHGEARTSSALVSSVSSISNTNDSSLELGTRSTTDVPHVVVVVASEENRSHSIEQMDQGVSTAEVAATGTGTAVRRTTTTTTNPSTSGKKADMMACETCGKSFPSLSKLTAHLRVHSGQRPFKRSSCDKRFAVKGNLNVHRNQVHLNAPMSRRRMRLACVFCNRPFSKKSNLDDHLRTHTRERPYFCPNCPKEFTTRGNLTEHVRNHTGELPFSCQVCNKSFKGATVLSCHLRVHTGERPFGCPRPHCQSKFSQSAHLRRHLSTVHSR